MAAEIVQVAEAARRDECAGISVRNAITGTLGDVMMLTGLSRISFPEAGLERSGQPKPVVVSMAGMTIHKCYTYGTAWVAQVDSAVVYAVASEAC